MVMDLSNLNAMEHGLGLVSEVIATDLDEEVARTR